MKILFTFGQEGGNNCKGHCGCCSALSEYLFLDLGDEDMNFSWNFRIHKFFCRVYYSSVYNSLKIQNEVFPKKFRSF